MSSRKNPALRSRQSLKPSRSQSGSARNAKRDPPSHTSNALRNARRDSPRGSKRESSRRESSRDDGMTLLYGLHAVRSALSNPRRRVVKIWLTTKAHAALRSALETRARAKPTLTLTDPATITRLAGGGGHQGAAALCAALALEPLSRFVRTARLGLAIDGAQDPRNLGAALRAAAAFGADFVMLPMRGSAPLSAVAARAAAGALDRIPIVQTDSLPRGLLTCREGGMNIIGLDHNARTEFGSALSELDSNTRLALAVGGEGSGLSAPVRRQCHTLARLPMLSAQAADPLTLNLATAAAIALYETRRQRSSVG